MTFRLVAAITLAVSALGLGTTWSAGASTGGWTGYAPLSTAEADDHIVIAGGFELPSRGRAEDVVVIEGDVLVEGTVEGDLIAVEGDVTIAGGTVEGDLTTVAGRGLLERGASVEGDLLYGDEEPEISSATVVGEVRDEGWSDIGDAPWGVIGAVALWVAVTVSLLVLGVTAVALAPRVAEAAHHAADSSLGAAIGLGFAALVGLPLLAALALVSVIGIPLGIGILLALIPLAAIAYVTTSFVLGRAIVPAGVHPILAFLAGFGILRAIALIPFAGALVWLAAVVLGLGSLIVAGWRGGPAGEAEASAGAG
jgi:hypothetical protein